MILKPVVIYNHLADSQWLHCLERRSEVEEHSVVVALSKLEVTAWVTVPICYMKIN